MSEKERATVVMLRGNSETRLQQALRDGLVRNEIVKDVEQVLKESDEAREWANEMQRQNYGLLQANIELQRQGGEAQRHNIELQRELQRRTAEYENARRVYSNEKKKAKTKKDTLMFWIELATIFMLGVLVIFCGMALYHGLFIR